MSRNSWEARRTEPLRIEECDEPDWHVDFGGRTTLPKRRQHRAACVSLICPDTGKVTLHDASDLRAQLVQLRTCGEP
jgi:hypothetical protein